MFISGTHGHPPGTLALLPDPCAGERVHLIYTIACLIAENRTVLCGLADTCNDFYLAFQALMKLYWELQDDILLTLKCKTL